MREFNRKTFSSSSIPSSKSQNRVVIDFIRIGLTKTKKETELNGKKNTKIMSTNAKRSKRKTYVCNRFVWFCIRNDNRNENFGCAKWSKCPRKTKAHNQRFLISSFVWMIFVSCVLFVYAEQQINNDKIDHGECVEFSGAAEQRRRQGRISHCRLCYFETKLEFLRKWQHKTSDSFFLMFALHRETTIQ